MTARFVQAVIDRLERLAAGPILLAGSVPDALRRHCRNRRGTAPPTVIDELAVAALDGLGRFRLGVLALPAGGDRKALTAILARLRDVHCENLLLLVPLADDNSSAGGWKDAELVALGCERRLADPDSGLGLYEFRIASYKRTPDWLNPANWANPERWDKERW